MHMGDDEVIAAVVSGEAPALMAAWREADAEATRFNALLDAAGITARAVPIFTQDGRAVLRCALSPAEARQLARVLGELGLALPPGVEVA